MKRIIIVGAGASGMMAAIVARRAGADVIVLEQNEEVGKKILATGNGKCNFSNIYQEPLCYRSNEPKKAWDIVNRFSYQDTIRFFTELGIYSKNKNGYLYPNSEQASSVRDVLFLEMENLGVKLKTGIHVKNIWHEKECWHVTDNKTVYQADAVIVASGSQASNIKGSDGNGYMFAKENGLHVITPIPALVQLKCREKVYKHLAGVRTQVKISLYINNVFTASDTGELQLTNYGISGIPTFQVSRFAAKALYEKKEVHAILDFAPEFEKEQFERFLRHRKKLCGKRKMKDFFTGLFHEKLSATWLMIARIDLEKYAEELSEEELLKLIRIIKEFKTVIIDTNPYTQAQVCAGGVDLNDLTKDLESKKNKGLYFIGEVVDVDGMCGGYNLQWAWSSGFIAGTHASMQ